jgi:hypothetical protein
MPSICDQDIDRLTSQCIEAMGDIFWDFDAIRDASCDYTDPRTIASRCVLETLKKLQTWCDSDSESPVFLLDEYESIVESLPPEPTDGEVIAALVSEGDWTPEGATEVNRLARMYGWAILRNATALAEALGIEDGESGL